MNSLSIIFLFILILTNYCDSCKITIKLKSQTKSKFKIQILVPSVKQKSERLLFTGPEEKKLQIDGENCLSKKWIVRTWKPDSSSGWVIAKEDSAFIDGMGWVRIIIGDDLRPQMKDRLSVFCSESPLCG
uniref:Uncharacterized protein n=1 Tax=Meloidogyne incognita TaxID=6306 RepID=A0A914LIU6_MELIC